MNDVLEFVSFFIPITLVVLALAFFAYGLFLYATILFLLYVWTVMYDPYGPIVEKSNLQKRGKK